MLTLAVNFSSSCPRFPSAGIAGMWYHACPQWASGPALYKMQAEWAMGTKSVCRIPSWSLLLFLSPISSLEFCPDLPQLWTWKWRWNKPLLHQGFGQCFITAPESKLEPCLLLIFISEHWVQIFQPRLCTVVSHLCQDCFIHSSDFSIAVTGLLFLSPWDSFDMKYSSKRLMCWRLSFLLVSQIIGWWLDHKDSDLINRLIHWHM